MLGDFDGDLTWTLTANEQPASIPVYLRAPYFIEPFTDAANDNEPPTIHSARDGEAFTGPPVGIAHTLTTTVGVPVELSVWMSDVTLAKVVDAIPNPLFHPVPLTLCWHLHRGPTAVEFAEPAQEFEDSTDQNPTTTATFSAPGEYRLRAEALDDTHMGDGGFQCCWTSAIVRVTASR